MKSAGKWHLIFLMNDWTSPSDLPNVPNQCYKVYLQIWHISQRQVETIIFFMIISQSRSQHLLSILSCMFPTIRINESGKKGSIKWVDFALWKLEKEIPPPPPPPCFPEVRFPSELTWDILIEDYLPGRANVITCPSLFSKRIQPPEPTVTFGSSSARPAVFCQAYRHATLAATNYSDTSDFHDLVRPACWTLNLNYSPSKSLIDSSLAVCLAE